MDEPRITARLPKIVEANPEQGGHKFGTFAGVFTPSLLTILGVIMFMRTGFVVGEAGLIGALAILFVAKAITLLTSCSVSAIATNMQVRGGGAYFMISRVLGPEFGGAIGLALFFAQALSVPFYILGFTEALVQTYPNLQNDYLSITCATAALLFVVAYIGANWAIKTQFFIMAILLSAIITIVIGVAWHFDGPQFKQNLWSAYTPTSAAAGAPEHNFWTIFAIYFPAVTGILAGVNMSGDLKDPARSIPRGTFLAVGSSAVVYCVLMVLLAGVSDQEGLITKRLELLQDHAWFGLSGLVSAGVFAATLSSALGSYLGAPRILQAVSRDDILAPLRPFAKGTAPSDEPRPALWLTGLLTYLVLLWAGNDSEGGPLNAVASIITMFFLYTYGMINLAAFIEAIGQNPSFRPKFRFFHWSSALFGGLGCLFAAFLIDMGAALVAAGILAFLLWTIKTRDLQTNFGDARRGLIYTSVRRNLLRLANMEEDSKNWRPTILVFSGNPASREALATFAAWLESGRGLVLLANVIRGSFDDPDIEQRRKEAAEQLKTFCQTKGIQAFPVIANNPDIDDCLAFLLQSTTIGPIRPNIAMFGWTHNSKRAQVLARHLRISSAIGAGMVLIRDRGIPINARPKRIDVWWRGQRNGALMLLFAHLLTRNWEWLRATVRVLRVVQHDLDLGSATAEIHELVDRARVKANAEAVSSRGQAFADILYAKSRDADCVFLGFETPSENDARGWHEGYERLLKGLPTTILVCSAGKEDVFA